MPPRMAIVAVVAHSRRVATCPRAMNALVPHHPHHPGDSCPLHHPDRVCQPHGAMAHAQTARTRSIPFLGFQSFLNASIDHTWRRRWSSCPSTASASSRRAKRRALSLHHRPRSRRLRHPNRAKSFRRTLAMPIMGLRVQPQAQHQSTVFFRLLDQSRLRRRPWYVQRHAPTYL